MGRADAENNVNNNKLEKNLTSLNVWALAFGCVIGFGAFIMPGDSFLVKAGPAGTAIAMGIAMAIIIVIALNYAYMIHLYPIAGGEYTYTVISFGKGCGFWCSWFLSLSYLSLVALNATALALIGKNLMGNVFRVGYLYSVAGYDIYLGEVLLAAAALILFAFLSSHSVKIVGRVQTIFSFALIVGVLVLTVASICKNGMSLSRIAPFFYEEESKVTGILAVLAVAPFAFIGFDTVPQAAEEFKFKANKTKLLLFLAVIFGAFVYISLNTITAANFPPEYHSWKEWIQHLSELDGLYALPTFYAAYSLLENCGLWVIGMAVLAAVCSGILGFYLATSRMLYALSREKVIPDWFGKLSSKYKTPVNAIIFVLLISLIAPFGGRTVLNWIVDMTSVGAAIGYGFTSGAAMLSARKNNRKWYVFTGGTGVIISLLFMVLLLVPFPGSQSSLGKESYIALGIWILLGIIFSITQKKKGEIS